MAGDPKEAEALPLTILSDLEKRVHTAFPESNLSTLARIGNPELVEEFLGEKVTTKVSGSESAQLKSLQAQLYIAAFWGFADMVRQLAQLGLDVNAANHSSLWTPMHAAAFQEHGQVIALLFDLGADPNLIDAAGRSAVDFASASDKVWPLFAAKGFRRVPKTKLVELGILDHVPQFDSEPTLPSREDSFMDELRRASSRQRTALPTNPITGGVVGDFSDPSRRASSRVANGHDEFK